MVYDNDIGLKYFNYYNIKYFYSKCLQKKISSDYFFLRGVRVNIAGFVVFEGKIKLIDEYMVYMKHVYYICKIKNLSLSKFV